MPITSESRFGTRIHRQVTGRRCLCWRWKTADKLNMIRSLSKSAVFSLPVALVISVLARGHTAVAEIAVKSGEKIGFLGDSITAGGWSNPVGYVRLVIAGLAANGVNAEAVPAGISGHKSDQML